MGLFNNKIDRRAFASISSLAREAYLHTMGSLDGRLLRYRDAEVDLNDGANRLKVGQRLGELIDTGVLRLPAREASAKIDELNRGMNANKGSPAFPFECAALQILIGLWKADMVAFGAMRFPKDRELNELANKCMVACFATLQAIAGVWDVPGEPEKVFDPAMAELVVLLQEAPNLNAFFERRTGLDKW